MNVDHDCRAGQVYLEDTLKTYACTASVPIDEIRWLPTSTTSTTCDCIILSQEQQVYWPIDAYFLADTRYCVELARRAEMIIQELQRGLSNPLAYAKLDTEQVLEE